MSGSGPKFPIASTGAKLREATKPAEANHEADKSQQQYFEKKAALVARYKKRKEQALADERAKRGSEEEGHVDSPVHIGVQEKDKMRASREERELMLEVGRGELEKLKSTSEQTVEVTKARGAVENEPGLIRRMDQNKDDYGQSSSERHIVDALLEALEQETFDI